MSAREQLLRSAVRISQLSVASGAVLGATALILALASGSLSLLGYGLDSLVDSAASVLLVHRFHMEPIDPSRAEGLERRAHRAISGVLVAGGLYVGVEAIRALVSGAAPHRSAGGIIIAGLSLLVLPPLAYAKRKLAKQLGSGALRADSVLTGVAALLAGLALVGVGLDRFLGVEWADGAAALVISLVLETEGIRGARDSRRRRLGM